MNDLVRPWPARLGDALTTEHFQRHDRYVKWARNPLTNLILAAIASALCGLCLHPQGLVLSCGLVALIAAGVAWPWLGVRGLRGTISFERVRSREGEPVKATLSLVNRRPWGAWGLSVHVGLGRESALGLSRAAGWTKTETTWDFVPDRRGVYPEGTPRVASGFPFGLSTSSQVLEISNPLVVWPGTFPVGPMPRVSGGLYKEGDALRNRPGGSGDFLGVRPYRRGDSLRRVHWPQTARLGQMVVCELQSNAVPRAQIVLDAHPAGHFGAGAGGSREWSIRIAASFVEAWIGQGAEVELVVDGVAFPARGGSVASRRAVLLDVLARVGPGGIMGLTEMLDAQPCRRFTSGLRAVVATDLAASRLDPRTASGASECFVILKGAAFDPTGASPDAGPMPIRPWAWVDDPTRVAQQVRRVGKGVLVEA